MVSNSGHSTYVQLETEDATVGCSSAPNLGTAADAINEVEQRKSSAKVAKFPMSGIQTVDPLDHPLQPKEKPPRAHKCKVAREICDWCDLTVPSGQLAIHRMSDCDRKQVPCPQCDMLVPCPELKTHKAVFCLGRDALCSQCDCKMTLFRLGGHVKSCTFRKISCPDCKGVISLNRRITQEATPCAECKSDLYCKECWDSKKSLALNLHRTKACPQRRVACQYCIKTTTASTLKDHLRSTHPMRVSEERRRILCARSFWLNVLLSLTVLSMVVVFFVIILRVLHRELDKLHRPGQGPSGGVFSPKVNE